MARMGSESTAISQLHDPNKSCPPTKGIQQTLLQTAQPGLPNKRVLEGDDRGMARGVPNNDIMTLEGVGELFGGGIKDVK